MSYLSLESRLRKLEQRNKLYNTKVYIFRVGDHKSCTHESEEELEKELQHPKYEHAIVIRDLDHWVEDDGRIMTRWGEINEEAISDI